MRWAELVALGAGRELGETCAYKQKTGDKDDAMRSAPLMSPDARKILGKGRAVRKQH